MSPQIIELLIFAVIAFYIINKLITTLGSTSEEEQTKQKSYFGEPVIKDVTYSIVKSNKEEKIFQQPKILKLLKI